MTEQWKNKSARFGWLAGAIAGAALTASVAALGELGSDIRDQFLMGPRITAAINARDDAERARLQGIVQDKEKHVQELLQRYETSLIDDAIALARASSQEPIYS